MMDPLQKCVNEFLRTHLKANTAHPPVIVVGVSGGIDSMVLLHLLKEAQKYQRFTLRAVHINHQLRSSAISHEYFVKQTCEAWQIECQIDRVSLDDIPSRSRRGLEADARVLRYKALWNAVTQRSANFLMTAHHGDDQIETILWRWLRGTTLTGLKGILPMRNTPEGLHARPLLSASKVEIFNYAKQHEIPHVEDESNQSHEFIRNRIRHQILPELKSIQPELISVTARMADILREEDSFLTELAEQQLNENIKHISAHAVLSVEKWRDIPLPLQRRAIQILLYCFAQEDWTFSHVESILGLLSHRVPSASITLPGGLLAYRKYAELWIGPTKESNFSLSDAPWELGRTRTAFVGDSIWKWDFSVTALESSHSIHTAKKWECFIPPVGNVILRSLKTSEKTLLFHGVGHKKVQDIFTDAKVPKPWREAWPALVIDGHIVWIPGVFRSGHAKLANEVAGGWHVRVIPPFLVRNYFFGHGGETRDV